MVGFVAFAVVAVVVDGGAAAGAVIVAVVVVVGVRWWVIQEDSREFLALGGHWEDLRPF